MMPLLLLLALAPGLVAAEFLLLEPESFKPLYHDGKINATGPTDQVRGPSSCAAAQCRSRWRSSLARAATAANCSTTGRHVQYKRPLLCPFVEKKIGQIMRNHSAEPGAALRRQARCLTQATDDLLRHAGAAERAGLRMGEGQRAFL